MPFWGFERMIRRTEVPTVRMEKVHIMIWVFREMEMSVGEDIFAGCAWKFGGGEESRMGCEVVLGLGG